MIEPKTYFNPNDLEETLKTKVHQYFFNKYIYTQIGRIDFALSNADSKQLNLFNNDYTYYYLWAEAKRGCNRDLYESFVQLIFTIGKEKTYENNLPPLFLGAFDSEKIAFIQYRTIESVLTQNDFNWKVAPSNHNTIEFKQLYKLVSNALKKNSCIFYYNNVNEITNFIKDNFKNGNRKINKIKVNKNNFISIYYRWLDRVRETIDIDWEVAKQYGIIDADFYLADLLSNNDETVKDSLFVVLNTNHYEFARTKDIIGDCFRSTTFKDNQESHKNFWMVYKRPPKKEFWDYIIKRRDLLVPQDIRERKGSYFTPKIWVEKSQEYIANVLGENWQDEYYIWDCCAGTGNLLNGLTDKYKIWASTIDQADVDVMKDRIKNGANLLESHIFQFDFLNDDFNDVKLPESLRAILNSEKERQKLLIYINPPYAEADNRSGKGRSNVAASKIYHQYESFMGYTKRELFIQFLTRIYKEIPECKLGLFSTLKHIQSPRFKCFRNKFIARLKSIFIVPANTFDNVKGDFPIAFQVWDLHDNHGIENVFLADVINEKSIFLGQKHIISYNSNNLINDWIEQYRGSKIDNNSLGTAIAIASDFQNQRTVRIEKPNQIVKASNHNWQISFNNLYQSCVYLAVRLIPNATWINDRDNFMYPNCDVTKDIDFCNNCLVYMMFHSQNKVSITDGVNHWIPFKEDDVNAKELYKSRAMCSFISNLHLSESANNVMNSAKKIYRYYHTKTCSCNDASFYDIKLYFQKKNSKGIMNHKSDDNYYESLIFDFKNNMKILSNAIEPKIYEYGFLLK